jgi:hypothetical protein
VKGYCLDDEGVRQIASRASGRHAEAWLTGALDGDRELTGLEPPVEAGGSGGRETPERPPGTAAD